MGIVGTNFCLIFAGHASRFDLRAEFGDALRKGSEDGSADAQSGISPQSFCTIILANWSNVVLGVQHAGSGGHHMSRNLAHFVSFLLKTTGVALMRCVVTQKASATLSSGGCDKVSGHCSSGAWRTGRT